VVESDLSRTPAGLRSIADLVRENEIDVIHTHMSRAHTFGTLLRLLVSTPLVKTAHSRSFQLHWRVNDFVIANSLATEQYHTRTNRVPQRKIQTVHCFIDSDKVEQVTPKRQRIVRRQLRWNDGEFLIGIVGQVIARKGHQYLFEALPKLLREIPNARMVVIGRYHRRQPYVRKVRKFLNENGLHRITRWTGLRFNIPDFLAAMDVCVVPSLEEPLGLVAIESQACGTPVVASRTGGLCEVVEDGVTGLLVPPKDPNAIADAILRIRADEKLRRKIAYRGKLQYEAKFATDFLASQIEGVYEKIVSRKLRKAA
jgi:glycosyltransferase involved in cell wall biosynthesis